MIAITRKTHPPDQPTENVAGYSLTELLVIVAIMATLAMQAAPAFQQAIGTAKQRVYSHALHDAIHLAHQTARIEGSTVTLCPLATNEVCGNDWSRGWVLLRSDGTEQEPKTIAVKQKPIADRHIKITANREQFTFEPSGRNTNGTVVVCASGSDQPWAVIVSYTGRSRVAQPATDGVAGCA